MFETVVLENKNKRCPETMLIYIITRPVDTKQNLDVHKTFLLFLKCHKNAMLYIKLRLCVDKSLWFNLLWPRYWSKFLAKQELIANEPLPNLENNQMAETFSKKTQVLDRFCWLQRKIIFQKAPSHPQRKEKRVKLTSFCKEMFTIAVSRYMVQKWASV